MTKNSYMPPWKIRESKMKGDENDSPFNDKEKSVLGEFGNDEDDEKDGEDVSKPLSDAKIISIQKMGPSNGKMKVTHEDGQKSDHEFNDLEELKSKLDKFFDSEEKEWKEDPEEEKEAHKGDFDDEESSNPFTDFSSMLGK